MKQVHDQTTYWLNYPPAGPIRLGTIVMREGGVWIPVGNVEDRGVVIESEVDLSVAGTPYTSSSSSGVTIESALDLDPGALRHLIPGEAGAKVSFASGSKYLLSLAGARFDRIKSIERFWGDVKLAYSVWTWDLRKKVVTSVCRADSGTFLGSGDSAATYELKAELDANVQGVDLGTLAAGFSLASTASSAETFVGMKDVTPLFRLHKVTLFGNLDAATVADHGDQPPTTDTALQADDTSPNSDDDQ